jgi:2-succinyl-5-enolpyruvyl-6-hydroxy-3-cyclohexene-1-carboxylate synthase
LAADDRLSCHSLIDERAAGFFAIGLARATGRPAVLACTSGTAAANYLPAVIEAHEAGLPLIVLSADRPPELRDVGAGQAIDQLKLYGSAVRWFQELDTTLATPERLRWIRQLTCRAAATALGLTGDRPGPVHLNVPLREPLVLHRPLGTEPGDGGRAGEEPWTRFTPAPSDPRPVEAWLQRYGAADGVVVAGEGAPRRTAELAQSLGWPLLADPLSGARTGPAAIAHYDMILRSGHWRPGAVLRVGALPTSKPLRHWLGGMECPQACVASKSGWSDPGGVITEHLPAVDELSPAISTNDDSWLTRWREADKHALAAIKTELDDGLNEPSIARALADTEGQLVVASSMPIREVESFFPVDASVVTVHANRGANGIDGTISTAFGVAAGTPTMPTRLLIGDVAFVYDIGGLAAGCRLGLDLTIVLVDNGGGGIFDHLPVGKIGGADYEHHIATAPGLNIEHMAAAVGARYEMIDALDVLRGALRRAPEGTTVLHVQTSRPENVALHARVNAAVTAAVT